MAPQTTMNPTYAWANAQQQQQAVRPLNRSTSVEYENQAQTAGLRRLAAKPPSRTGSATSTIVNGGLAPPVVAAGPRRVVPRTNSLRSVPDSEPEETNAIGRARSPLAEAATAIRQSVSTVVNEVGFIMRARSREPEPAAVPQDSYDYSQEEREVQAAQPGPARRPAPVATRKNKISQDHAAYKPSQSDYEDSEEEDDDGKRKRRRRKKDAMGGGSLTTLPVAGYDKKKRRKRGKAGAAEDEEEEEDDSTEQVESSFHVPGSDPDEVIQASTRGVTPAASLTNLRTTAPPSRSQPSLSRGSLQSASHFGLDAATGDASVQLNTTEEGLQSIVEESEHHAHAFAQPSPVNKRAASLGSTRIPDVDGYRRAKSATGSVATSPGALAGAVVLNLGRILGALLSAFLRTLATGVFLVGKSFGFTYDAFFGTPLRFVTKSQGTAAQILRGLILLGGAYGVFYAVREPLARLNTGVQPASVYTPPSAPAADVSELAARLLTLERSLGDLSTSNVQERNRADKEAERREELQAKLNALERNLRDETKRATDAEERARTAERTSMNDLKRELDSLRAAVANMPRQTAPSGPVSDAEARTRLKTLEEKLAGVEEEAKEALELGKDAVARSAKPSGSWWSKSGSTPGQLTIKASDGSDVSALIGRLVDNAFGLLQKDGLARADFALHSGGAAVIPSLTSETYALRPHGIGGKVLGLMTGHGYAVGRPPVTALHHELHIGHCWPFAGARGQLGIKLAAPVFVDAVTVDHVAKEVAFDMRTAPREMELWGLVEGAENVERVRAYHAEKARVRAEERAAAGEPPAYDDDDDDDDDEELTPAELGPDALYFRIARFAYDAHAAAHVQTFAVPEDVRALRIDFGVVALRVTSNWGHAEFTCVYRVRVHGERLEPLPLLDPPAEAEEQA
jgi:SUN domain-containing protein 1/2